MREAMFKENIRKGQTYAGKTSNSTIVEVKCTLNSRPLTYEYDEVGEEVLTPSHLIFGRRISSLPDLVDEPEEDTGGREYSARFKYLSNRLEHFWNRWRKEYLTSLREFHRNKGREPVTAPEVGDVVVVEDEGSKRCEWKMGIVVELVKGRSV